MASRNKKPGKFGRVVVVVLDDKRSEQAEQAGNKIQRPPQVFQGQRVLNLAGRSVAQTYWRSIRPNNLLLSRKFVCVSENNSVSLHLCFISVDADEIKRLGKRFKKLDLDNSGSLSVEEFMSLPELQQNPLVQRVIDIFDTDGNGEVDFKGKEKNPLQ